MSTIRDRFPPRDVMWHALAVCILPVYIWSIINVLREVPAWILRLNIWDLIGAVAYTQAFALFESMLIFIGILVLAILLPQKFFRRKFLELTTAIVTLSAFWVILAHYNDETIRTWGMKQFLPWFVVYAVTLFLSYIIILRFEKIGTVMGAVARRFSMLSFFYVILGVMSIIIVIIRNIAEAL